MVETCQIMTVHPRHRPRYELSWSFCLTGPASSAGYHPQTMLHRSSPVWHWPQPVVPAKRRIATYSSPLGCVLSMESSSPFPAFGQFSTDFSCSIFSNFAEKPIAGSVHLMETLFVSGTAPGNLIICLYIQRFEMSCHILVTIPHCYSFSQTDLLSYGKAPREVRIARLRSSLESVT